MAQPRRTHLQQRLHAQRRKVLNSAARAFARLGFRATTMDDIAREVRATRGLVYYHFRSKAEIFYELHMAALDELIDGFHRSVDRVRGPAQKLERAIQAHVDFTCRRLTLAGVTSRMMEIHNARDFPRRYREAIVAKRDEYERLFKELIQEGVAQGVFRTTDVSVAEKTVLGALNWMVFWYRPRGRLSAAQLTRLTTENVLRGILAASVNA